MNFLRRIFHPIKNIKAYKAKRIRNDSSLSDEEFLKKMFKVRMGKVLNLDNPKTFNEKLQWLKLYDRKNIYTTMVDKHSVKEYVSSLIGDKYIAKEYGFWDYIEPSIFDKLPYSFVLKTTHGCGKMLVCHDKNAINFEKVCKEFDSNLKQNYYYRSREWPYKNVKPKVIAEELLINEGETVLTVYKFFCFNGEPHIVQVIHNDKTSRERIDYFDMNWSFLELRQNFKNSDVIPTKPDTFEEMKDICRKLTKGIPFVRCDLYEVNKKVFFSEFTFFSDAGFERFHPDKWDEILGSKIVLPK